MDAAVGNRSSSGSQPTKTLASTTSHGIAVLPLQRSSPTTPAQPGPFSSSHLFRRLECSSALRHFDDVFFFGLTTCAAARTARFAALVMRNRPPQRQWHRTAWRTGSRTPEQIRFLIVFSYLETFYIFFGSCIILASRSPPWGGCPANGSPPSLVLGRDARLP